MNALGLWCPKPETDTSPFLNFSAKGHGMKTFHGYDLSIRLARKTKRDYTGKASARKGSDFPAARCEGAINPEKLIYRDLGGQVVDDSGLF